jgi:sulfhydrogenase subunit gamma (sulfur reductase)
MPAQATLRSVEELVPGDYLYEFAISETDGLNGHDLKRCMPGQFVEVWFPGVGESAISVCTGKVDGTMQLLIRRVGRVTTSLPNMEKGHLVGIRGPYGRGFPVEFYKGKDLCLVAGGCGVAPIRGLWQYLLDHRQDYGKILLVYGMRRPADMLFAREFKELAARKDIDLHLAAEDLSGGAEPPVPMIKGLVTLALAKAPVTPDFQIAVCGPPIMYKFVVRDLRKRNIPDANMWLSLERHMKCGVGKCGHCFVGGKFTCKSGPVFRLDELQFLPETVECEKV